MMQPIIIPDMEIKKEGSKITIKQDKKYSIAYWFAVIIEAFLGD